ncbi:CRISPR-associated endoribonuclease Cas6 [Clostridium saccharobutylicum]|uniref:CRISPR associated protein Cas6 C-terminal domain-containing protein n=1 Tax=Clostridium saccharobutylicum DSM 13864 TaxID=1345695 RepID=U5MQB9_CLOSA|nr:CRISPR-associated endoribonuclease Cas6 [Clostridium saccharobutylicum]AGX42974.1 hypothetical protein CLSA_c19900 [Clostridium saccharobutylicum DSM 13864]AQR90267.1 CRISPR associated protein Cas6 [Clostridium saccharobutylicum]AQS00173.1 CRISPR associated protein Cas6 [Clostridium saccharobutylicum]AQS09972.1 CRISPR associated protein Cas6 [Clostridium saccharobutylicum]AQS14156.1 CRISPR associated protein Cas6 [Clostridium saccharobutylicum]
MIKVYELIVKTYCLKSISDSKALEKISSLIDKAFLNSEDMCKYHNSREYKFYSHDTFDPWTPSGVSVGEIRSFKIRTVDSKLKNYLMTNLLELSTDSLLVLYVTDKVIPKGELSQIESVTPIIIKTEVGYWRNNYDDEFFIDRITANLIKKYNAFTGKNIPLADIELFNKITLKKSHIKRRYKNITLFGDRYVFYLKDDELSQDIGYFALGSGVAEMCPRGFAFMQYQYKK